MTVPPVILSGDWAWRDQVSRFLTPGGMAEGADVILACDIDNWELFVPSGGRIIVDEIECAIVAMSPYPDTGEMVVAGKRVV